MSGVSEEGGIHSRNAKTWAVGAHHGIRLGPNWIDNLTGTARPPLGRKTRDRSRAIAAEGDRHGRRKAASGNKGQEERRFRNRNANQLLSVDLAAPLAEQ